MSRFSEKGYFVKENAPVYLTPDMDRLPGGLKRFWVGTAISLNGILTAEAAMGLFLICCQK